MNNNCEPWLLAVLIELSDVLLLFISHINVSHESAGTSDDAFHNAATTKEKGYQRLWSSEAEKDSIYPCNPLFHGSRWTFFRTLRDSSFLSRRCLINIWWVQREIFTLRRHGDIHKNLLFTPSRCNATFRIEERNRRRGKWRKSALGTVRGSSCVLVCIFDAYTFVYKYTLIASSSPWRYTCNFISFLTIFFIYMSIQWSPSDCRFFSSISPIMKLSK